MVLHGEPIINMNLTNSISIRSILAFLSIRAIEICAAFGGEKKDDVNLVAKEVN